MTGSRSVSVLSGDAVHPGALREAVVGVQGSSVTVTLPDGDRFEVRPAADPDAPLIRPPTPDGDAASRPGTKIG
ncbi:hypothetical protein [Streptosporangium brasiliense]|uniref:Uncharacterized protein n=1 Tax=Streptosporangium brasiliense TaxID=47480 RepID=A0ABT9R5E5_9ACTN|nr:hypothetical protein [Streptosporangium brasiliense]MDP9864462.1 hypothetical protein [Streptosporangium brasiliense]